MNDRVTANTNRTEWPVRSADALRSEERKVLVVLLLYGALILFAIWGVKVLDRVDQAPQGSVPVDGAA